MKKNKIKHLFALGLMLGVGGCKSSEAIKGCGCNTGLESDIITKDIIVYYGGLGIPFDGSRNFEHWFEKVGGEAFAVCDSIKLKSVKLVPYDKQNLVHC